MNGPDPRLMRLLHTEDVYEQKLAGFAPFAGRMARGLLNLRLDQNEEHRLLVLHQQAAEMNQALAYTRALSMRPVNRTLRHASVPFAMVSGRGEDEPDGLDLPPPMQLGPSMMQGDRIPLGFDEGMVRLASAIGRDLVYVDFDAMVKSAGIGSVLGGAVKNIGAGLGNAASSVGKGLGAMTGGMGRGLAMGGMRASNAVAGAGQAAASKLLRTPGSIKNFAVGQLNSAKGFASGQINSAKAGITNLSNQAQSAIQSGGQRARTGIERTGNRIAGRLEQVGQKAETLGTGQPAPKVPFSQMSPGQRQLTIDARAQRMQQVKGTPPVPSGQLQPAAGSPPAPAAPKAPAPAPAAPTPSPARPPPPAPAPTGGQGTPAQPPPQTQSQPVAQKGGGPYRETPPPTPEPQGKVTPPASPPATPPGGPAPPGQVTEPAENKGFFGGNLQKAWDRTGLSNGRLLPKAALLGAGAAGLYGAYRGAKALSDKFSEESAPSQFNQGGAMPARGVNEYGYTG